jgi:uncharacterized integral membrane protein (TIGR00698 family)
MKILVGLVLIAITIYSGSPVVSLFLGVLYSFSFNLPDDYFTKKYGSTLIQIGIVILGLSISLTETYALTSIYLPYISLFVMIIFFFGIFLGKLFGVDNKTTLLISSGTAICGASAIAAISPIIRANSNQLLISFTIIFLLNSIAIIIFPYIGNYLSLNGHMFGAWVALTIHDTSSVVGAAMAFGNNSIETAATLKLGRTLFIIPLIIFLSYKFKTNDSNNIKFPFFVSFFIISIFLGSFLDFTEQSIINIQLSSKIFLLFGLFFIGSQISLKSISVLQPNTLLLGCILWFIAIPSSFYLVLNAIHP